MAKSQFSVGIRDKCESRRRSEISQEVRNEAEPADEVGGKTT